MNRKAFTLVELSIVLVIIGLLIGGLLVGQSLIESAKVVKIASKLRQYHIAINNFRVSYRYLPGDLLNGNSIFGQSYYYTGSGAGNGYWNRGPALSDFGDLMGGFEMWQQLSASRMVSEPYTIAGLATGWGTSGDVATFPKKNIPQITDGVVAYGISSDRLGNTLYTPAGGHRFANFICSNALIIVKLNSGSLSYPLTAYKPVFAKAIDEKIDDGIAFSGQLQAQASTYQVNCKDNDYGYNIDSLYDYKLTESGENCALLYCIDSKAPLK